jgi:hypothetical protein
LKNNITVKSVIAAYLISIIGLSAFFIFVTFNVKIAEINKDISFFDARLDENKKR